MSDASSILCRMCEGSRHSSGILLLILLFVFFLLLCFVFSSFTISILFLFISSDTVEDWGKSVSVSHPAVY